ncbi:hypothetical protein Droror1_Dr00003924 [Drosera rotundifolia]
MTRGVRVKIYLLPTRTRSSTNMTATPERNDPLWVDSLAGDELQPMPNIKYVCSDEERFVEQVLSLPLQPPTLLSHYLAGFGNSRVPSGRDIKFRMRSRSYSTTPLSTGVANPFAVFQAPYRMPPEISFSASAFAYRVFHAIEGVPQGTKAPWVVWNFNRTEDGAGYVPRGNAFRDREPEFLKIAEFRTTQYLMRSMLEALERAVGEGAPG